MSSYDDRYTSLCKKFGITPRGHYGRSATESCLRAALALTTLATSNHRTKLEGEGVIRVIFINSITFEMTGQITPEDILRRLANQLIAFRTEKTVEIKQCCTQAQPWIWSVESEEATIFMEFILNPEASIPDDLREEVRLALVKKAKSINKRVRNYDSEIARRKQGRHARAVVSLTKTLARLDSESRRLVTEIIRLDVVGPVSFALEEVRNGDNLARWQDEDVISEAERLSMDNESIVIL